MILVAQNAGSRAVIWSGIGLSLRALCADPRALAPPTLVTARVSRLDWVPWLALYARAAMEMAVINCSGGDLREPRREEAIARNLVTPYIDGELVSIEDPPDFALCRDDTIVGWAEVTTAVDGERLALENWIAKNDFSFTCNDLTHDWNIIPHKTARLDRLERETLVDLLVDWESNNSEERGFIDTWQHPPLVAQMLDVRIEWLQYMPPLHEEPTVSIVVPGYGGSVGPSLINDLAVDKASKKVAALTGRDGERHLIVLVNHDYPTAVGLALTDTDVPDELPELPSEITDVWLSAIKSLLWHYSVRDKTWRVIEIEPT